MVDQDQSALQVFAFPFSLEQGGAFITFSLANAGKTIEDMVPALEEEILNLQNDLISEREFQKIQNQMESNFIQSNSKMAGERSITKADVRRLLEEKRVRLVEKP